MKRAIILFLTFIIIPVFSIAQSIENVEFISPFHNDVAAILKDGKWAFINEEGNQIIPYRADLVTTETEAGNYPMFNDNRCPIVEIKDGISYFGFIDKSGKIVIEPQFLNTSDFNDGTAIALKLDRQVVGRNTALNKDLVNYRYFEVLINTDGEITYYLTQDGVNVILDEKYFGGIPQITSKQLAEDLYAVKNKSKTWNIIAAKIKMED